MNRIVGIVVLSFICLFFVFQTQSVSAQTTTNNFALRINAGGVENNYNGNTFVGDNLFNTGSTLDRPQTGLPEPFQTFRYSRSQEMSYDIPLEDGEYKVNLYFAELWFGATGGGSGGVGSRVFDVSLEGQLAEDNLDVFAEVGPDNLLMRSYTVTVTGEVLNIDFNSTDASGGERHPIINAIEILGNDIQTPQITVESVTNQSNEINEAISFGVSASGGDSNTPFSYAISGQPSGVDINEATGLITGTIDPNAALGGSNGDGIHNVTVAVSKSGHTDASTTFDWTITDATCEWNGLSDAAINRFEAISQKIGDKLYVFGGFTYGVKVVPETEIYDTTNDTWTTGASLPIPVTHTATVAVGTDIWIIGGFAGDNPGVATNAVQIYDTLTDSWSVGPALPNPVGSSAAALNGNKIFYVGGLQPDRQTNVADHLILDLTNIGGGWTLVAPMPNPRNHHSYISVNGIIYAIGGQFGHDGPKQDTKLVHAYNPNTDAWTQMTDLARPRSHFKAATTIHNGKIIIVGGVDNGPLVNDISQYDPQLNTWTELCKLPGEGLEEGAAQAFGDRLILSGGRPVRDANIMLKETRWMQLEPTTSQPPVVNAGQDQSIDLPTNAVVINGSGSDPDGGAVTYQWTQQNGPATSLLTNTTTNTLTASNLVEGTYIFRLTVTDDENETDFDEVSITVNEEPVVPDFALRINTGGTATNYTGEDFIADQYFNTGNTLDRPQTGLPEPYQSFRFSRSQEMSYDIPLEDGEYTVNLYFAELWFGATGGGSGGVGSRVFDVNIEGQLAEDNLDVFAEVGPDAMLLKSHTIIVSGGVLNIDFDSRDAVGGERHPIINGIEIARKSVQELPKIINLSMFSDPEQQNLSEYDFILEDGARFSPDYTGDIAIIDNLGGIRANFSGEVNSVKFTVLKPDGLFVERTDSDVPFTVYDNIEDAKSQDGFYFIVATPFSEVNGEGIVGEPYELTYEIFNRCEESRNQLLIELTPASCGNSDGTAVIKSRLTADFPNITWSHDSTLQSDTAIGLAPGIYRVDTGLIASCDIVGNLGLTFEIVSEEDCPEPNDFALRINAGGTETIYNAETFVTDTYFNTGNTLDRPQTGLPEPFQSFRYSRSQEMSYDIPVPNGEYNVRLYFAELWFGATGGGEGGVGKRVFDINIENELRRDNLDVYAQVGAEAMFETIYTTTVTDGILSIDFNSSDAVGGERHPIINAIEILGTNDNSLSSSILSGKMVISNPSTITPNPAITTTTLSFEKPVELTNIQIFDALGRLVHSYNGPEVADEGAYILQVNNLKSGTYFINSMDTQGIKHQKQMVIKK